MYVTWLFQITDSRLRPERAQVLQAGERSAETISSDSHEALNARRPFLSIPTELLQEIMAYIPDLVLSPSYGRFRPPWQPDLHDTAMLIPVSQTCRRLRSVALGCPSLWKDVACGPRLLSHYLIDRSCGLPLTVILSASQAPSLHFSLADVASALRTRIQELDIVQIPNDDTLDQLLSNAFPMLESLAVKRNGSGYYVDGTYANAVQLSRDRVPRLRRLAYSRCDLASLDILASLTHLALDMFHVGRMHEKIAGMLSVCHALQSLHLDAVSDYDHWLHNNPSSTLR